jgi:hypothetical protein
MWRLTWPLRVLAGRTGWFLRGGRSGRAVPGAGVARAGALLSGTVVCCQMQQRTGMQQAPGAGQQGQ